MVEDTQTINFFDGRNIHGAFQKYTVMNLNTICKRFLSTVRGKSRMEMYEIIAQAPPLSRKKFAKKLSTLRRNAGNHLLGWPWQLTANKRWVALPCLQAMRRMIPEFQTLIINFQRENLS